MNQGLKNFGSWFINNKSFFNFALAVLEITGLKGNFPSDNFFRRAQNEYFKNLLTDRPKKAEDWNSSFETGLRFQVVCHSYWIWQIGILFTFRWSSFSDFTIICRMFDVAAPSHLRFWQYFDELKINLIIMRITTVWWTDHRHSTSTFRLTASSCDTPS